MSCRCIREQDSHFTFRKEQKKKIKNKKTRASGVRGRVAAAPPFPCSAPPLLAGLLFPSQLDQEALWHFKRHKLACRGGFVGNTRKLETPGRADLDLIGACNYVAKPLCRA